MSIDALPSKQASAQSSLSALSTLSTGPKGANDAPSSFENYLTEARSAPIQTPAPRERPGNTSKADKETSADKSDTDSDAVENASRSDEKTTEAASPAAEATAPAPATVTPVTADGKDTDQPQDDAASESLVDAVELADAQSLLAAQAAALTAAQTNLAGAGATTSDRPLIQLSAQDKPDASRVAEQTPLLPGADRKTVRKEISLKGQDQHTETQATDADTGKQDPVTTAQVVDGTRNAGAARSARGKETLEPELVSGDQGTNNAKAQSSEQDFASILSPAISNAAAIRPHAETTSAITIANLPSNPHYEVSVPLDSPRFGSSIAGHLSTIISQSVDRADIQLNPRELGPIRVEVTVKDRETHVTLIANDARTVQAIDQSSNMLRTLLTDQGFTLGQFEVRSGSSGSDRSGNQQAWQNPAGQGQPGNQGSGSDGPALADLGGLASVQRSSRRLLDLFA